MRINEPLQRNRIVTRSRRPNQLKYGASHARVKTGHPPEQPMTIALLIALAGSLAAMTYIVRRMEQR